MWVAPPHRPGVKPPPAVPSAESRTCSHCSGPLTTLGVKVLGTMPHAGHPAGVLVLETFWCPHCGKVEFYQPR